MIKNYKKGFTLIELLAVIVILSIIAVITVPLIMNVIDKAKLGALEDSAYGLIESANLYYAKNMDSIENYTLFEIEKGKQISENKLDYKGSIDGNAKIVLTNKGEIALCLTSGKTYVKKDINDSKVTTATVSSDTTCTIPNIADDDFTISIGGSSSNYYDKDTIDIKINDLQSKIDNINSKIGTSDISNIGDGTINGAINKLNTSLSNHIIVSSVETGTLSVPAYSTISTTINITVPSGYKLVQVFPRTTNNTVWLNCDCYKASATTVTFSLANHNGSALPGIGYGYALFKKI